jgi:hypothetical protein
VTGGFLNLNVIGLPQLAGLIASLAIADDRRRGPGNLAPEGKHDSCHAAILRQALGECLRWQLPCLFGLQNAHNPLKHIGEF